MVEAEYTVLATNLLDYFNKFSPKRFVPHSLLLCARSVPDFLAAARTPHPPPSTLLKQRRFLFMLPPFGTILFYILFTIYS